MALEAQEHIQIYLNRIRRQHLQPAPDQNRSTITPQSSYGTESLHSDSSITDNDTSHFNLESLSPSILPAHPVPTDYQFCSNMIQSGHINNNETLSNVTLLSNDLILTALQNANVYNEK